MNKYEVTLHTFCDACFSQKTCKSKCKRMLTMEKFIQKYDNLARAYDKVCSEFGIITSTEKEQIKEHFLNDPK